MARLLRQRIAYLEQRGEELEELLFAIAKEAKKRGTPLHIPMTKAPIDGDQYITDVNSHELTLRLLSV